MRRAPRRRDIGALSIEIERARKLGQTDVARELRKKLRRWVRRWENDVRAAAEGLKKTPGATWRNCPNGSRHRWTVTQCNGDRDVLTCVECGHEKITACTFDEEFA